jgi:hypothetical protein
MEEKKLNCLDGKKRIPVCVYISIYMCLCIQSVFSKDIPDVFNHGGMNYKDTGFSLILTC